MQKKNFSETTGLPPAKLPTLLKPTCDHDMSPKELALRRQRAAAEYGAHRRRCLEDVEMNRKSLSVDETGCASAAEAKRSLNSQTESLKRAEVRKNQSAKDLISTLAKI